MKDFREAHPTPDSLDDIGVRRLSAAIILQAAEDYYNEVCQYFKVSRYPSKAIASLTQLRMMDLEMRTPLWESITDITPAEFRNTIIDWYRCRQNIPSFIRKWRGRLEQEEADPEDVQVYYEPGYLTNLLRDPRFSANYINRKRNDKYV